MLFVVAGVETAVAVAVILLCSFVVGAVAILSVTVDAVVADAIAVVLCCCCCGLLLGRIAVLVVVAVTVVIDVVNTVLLAFVTVPA